MKKILLILGFVSQLVVRFFFRLIYFVIVGEMEAVCLHAVLISHDEIGRAHV